MSGSPVTGLLFGGAKPTFPMIKGGVKSGLHQRVLILKMCIERAVCEPCSGHHIVHLEAGNAAVADEYGGGFDNAVSCACFFVCSYSHNDSLCKPFRCIEFRMIMIIRKGVKNGAEAPLLKFL